MDAAGAKTGTSWADIGKCFKMLIPEKETLSSDNAVLDAKKFVKELSGGKDGAFGLLGFDSVRVGKPGHFIQWETIAGDVKFLDSQQGIEDASAWFSLIEKGLWKNTVSAARLDNLDLKPENLYEFVKNAR